MSQGARGQQAAGRVGRRWAAHLWLLVPLVVWLGSGLLRVHLTLSDVEFDSQSSAGLLKSDPGLLYYLTERVIEAGGVSPADWRADPRIEHPGTLDIPAVFTVGQEFLIAQAYRLFGGELPLHVFCVWWMSFVAALAALGVFGAARALTGSSGWAAGAALLYGLTPANYRTVGVILIREDLSLPFYALHLWALARALGVTPAGSPGQSPGQSSGPARGLTARLAPRRSPLAAACAVLSLGVALATWHGMAFLVALEGSILVGVYVAHGANPLRTRAGRVALPLLVLGLACVPALRAKLGQTPPWSILAALLWIVGWLPARLAAGRGRRLGLASLLVGLLLALTRLLGAPSSDLAHVSSLVLSKLRHLGSFPEDPSALPFDVRLLWQGPFETASPAALWGGLFLLALLVPAGWLLEWPRVRPVAGALLSQRVRQGPGAVALHGLAWFALLALGLSWLVARVVVLTGIVGPIFVVALASALARTPRLPGPLPGPQAARRVRQVALGVVLIQGLLFANWARSYRIAWYQPALRQDEIATLVRTLPRLVPEGEAVAADFMNSTAILAHTGRPIVLQPKWERAESRARVERFWRAFYHGTPAELHALLVDDFDCRYLLVDRFTLWILRASRNVAGLPASCREPLPGSAAEALLDPDTPTEGFELIWRSPQTFLQSGGQPSDFFRLYRLAP